MQTSFRGRIVTRQDVIGAMRDFDRNYAGTEEYTSWLTHKSRKYLVWYNGLQYPPKHILSLVTGIGIAEFSGGEQTNRVFTDLGFKVVEVAGVKPSTGVLSSLSSQIKGIFAGKKSESSSDFEEPVIPGFSVRNSAQETDSKYVSSESTRSHGSPILQTASTEAIIVVTEDGNDELPSVPLTGQHQGDANVSPINWSQVPISVLTDRLAQRGGGGAQTARIIGAKRCRTVADVMKISDEQWLRCNGYSPNALAILHEELIALLTSPVSVHVVEEESHQVVQPDNEKTDTTEGPEYITLSHPAAIDTSLNGNLTAQFDQGHDNLVMSHDLHGVSPSSAPAEQPNDITKMVIDDWTQVPVTALTRRLTLSKGGARVIRAIHETRCRTLADIIEQTDEQWLKCRSFGQGSLHILHEELDALTALYEVRPSHTKLEPALNAATLPLNDPYWYPREWSELRNLLDIYGRQRLAAIPISGLVSPLRAQPMGDEVADKVVNHCTSMAELLAGDPSASSGTSFLMRFNSIQLNLLKVTATDYLRSELHVQPRNNETNKTSRFIATDSLQDERHRQPPYPGTLWEQIQDKLLISAAESLKSVSFRDVASEIQTIRVRNALLRHLSSDCSLYDLVIIRVEKLLEIPNLGVKSLDALKQELIDILNHLQPANDAVRQAELLPDTTDYELISDATVAAVTKQDWLSVRQSVDSLLNSREIDILKAYHGGFGANETLAAIGDRLGLTRERVRQIKSRASYRFQRRISAEVAARVFHDYALAKLATAGIEATPAALWVAPDDPRVVEDDERWLMDWFGDIYGRDWYTQWLLASAMHDNSDLQAIVGLTALSALVQFLRTYSYRPLNLEEALVVARTSEPAINAYELRVQLEEHPEVRVFPHGDLQIGHASWRWFDPQRARESRRVEWALRLIHAPATPTEIARVIRERLGVMEVSAFGVADACDRDPAVFFAQDGAYGLVIWQNTLSLREPLMNLLESGPLLLTELAVEWGKRFAAPFAPELVMATLHHCQEHFYPAKPLCWARKDMQEPLLYDPTAFTFERLMPTL